MTPRLLAHLTTIRLAAPPQVTHAAELRRRGRLLQSAPRGGMAERLKAHAWSACIRQKRIVGSNPTPSANTTFIILILFTNIFE